MSYLYTSFHCIMPYCCFCCFLFVLLLFYVKMKTCTSCLTNIPFFFNWMQMNRTPKLSYKMKDAIYFLYFKHHVKASTIYYTTAMHMPVHSSFIKSQLRSVKIITQTYPIYLYMQRCPVRSLMRFQILDFSSCRVIQSHHSFGKKFI